MFYSLKKTTIRVVCDTNSKGVLKSIASALSLSHKLTWICMNFPKLHVSMYKGKCQFIDLVFALKCYFSTSSPDLCEWKWLTLTYCTFATLGFSSLPCTDIVSNRSSVLYDKIGRNFHFKHKHILFSNSHYQSFPQCNKKLNGMRNKEIYCI